MKKDVRERMIKEMEELNERIAKLSTRILWIEKKIDNDLYNSLTWAQLWAMMSYRNILNERIKISESMLEEGD